MMLEYLPGKGSKEIHNGSGQERVLACVKK
jgi:hypothetical protein